jgi:Signal transduction histidine kinase
VKLTYKQKLALYFLIVFTLFTIGIVIFERSREKKFRTEALEEKLDAYTDIVRASLEQTHTSLSSIESLVDILPSNLRLTLIDRQGNVLYDNALEESTLSANHAERPEIIKAKASGKGSNIRVSSSNNKKYLYYAKRINDGFIRVAFPYDVKIQDFMKSDNLFLFFIIVLFIVTLLLINFVADRFGNSIKKLKEFALSDEQKLINTQIEFPEDELGEIGQKIIDNYEQLSEKKKEIALEREKLLLHVHSSGEGLCFFSKDKTVGFYNGLFIQYLNTITDESASDPAVIFTDRSFKNIVEFLSGTRQNEKYFATQISNNGKHFNIQVNIFEDGCFEIIINDITLQEKTRLLKQEMTSNIAHELRTPVTSIRGYLEIALGQSLDEIKTHDFLTKAHKQTVVLSELIQDMSLITKMEEAPVSFKQEDVYIEELLISLKNDLEKPLTEKNIFFEWKNISNVIIYGNSNLIYSIFRNLTDNAIRYAGTNVTITVNKYNEDKEFYYFSYSDTGIGIPGDNHLNRIFERFYRVNEGRTRDTGGSGLGLSIVKNAILFHKGTIIAKNKSGGGLEFLFKLPKTRT